MPCHHALAEELRAYIDAAGIAEDRKGWLFRTAPGHNAAVLSRKANGAARRLAHDPSTRGRGRHHAPIGNHSFRATGITAYLGQWRRAGACAGQWRRMKARARPSSRPTKERLTQDEVERIRLRTTPANEHLTPLLRRRCSGRALLLQSGSQLVASPIHGLWTLPI